MLGGLTEVCGEGQVSEMVWPADLADRVVAGGSVSKGCGRIRVHSLVSFCVH
jgi:hypothetical protein